MSDEDDMGQRAKFTQEEKNLLRDIVTRDEELKGLVIYTNIHNQERQAELSKRLVDQFNLESGMNYNKNQIFGCINRMKTAEIKERERRLVEGGVVDPETGEEFQFWLTVEQQQQTGTDPDVIVKSEPNKTKVKGASAFTKEDREQLRAIMTGDSEIRGLIFHGSSMSKHQCNELWGKLVDKFNEATGKNYSKAEIYNSLSKIKHKDRKGGQSRMVNEDTGVHDYWSYNDEPSGSYISAPAPTPGIDSILALLKAEYGGDIFEVDSMDWANPQTSYLKAILPGVLEEQRLKRSILELQNQNLKLQNKKLKMELRKEER